MARAGGRWPVAENGGERENEVVSQSLHNEVARVDRKPNETPSKIGNYSVFVTLCLCVFVLCF